MATAALRPGSIGIPLKRARLEHRAGRLQRVIRELEASASRYEDAPPAALRQAIRDFRAELAAVERELAAGSPA